MYMNDKKRSQTSMEFMMIAVFVAIVVLIVAFIYMSTATKSSKLGSDNNILAVGKNNKNQLIVVFSKTLPKNIKNIELILANNKSPISIALYNLVYVNNYPEYVFIGKVSAIQSNMSSIQYTTSNNTIVSITPIVGDSMYIKEVSTSVIQP